MRQKAIAIGVTLLLVLVLFAVMLPISIGEPSSRGARGFNDAGNTVVGTHLAGTVYEYDQSNNLVWQKGGFSAALGIDRLDNGNTLVTEWYGRRVVEVDSSGATVWSSTIPLVYPRRGYRLDNGNTLISDCRGSMVYEVDLANNIVWQYSPGGNVYDAKRLDNGNTLICDTTQDRVTEVDLSGNIVWTVPSTIVQNPLSAQRLPNGNTVISDYSHNRVVEVDMSLNVVWDSSVVYAPMWPIWDAQRLNNGNTLFVVAYSNAVYEIDMSGNLVWQQSVGGWPKCIERIEAPPIIDATIDIDPNTLNLESNGNWITGYVDFPTGYDVNDIDVSSVQLENAIPADWGEVQGTTQMLKFDRMAVEDLIGAPTDSIELEISGQITDGTPFVGTDSIRAIQN
jgi:hypothetical protein